jgi:hypothetical protein
MRWDLAAFIRFLNDELPFAQVALLRYYFMAWVWSYEKAVPGSMWMPGPVILPPEAAASVQPPKLPPIDQETLNRMTPAELEEYFKPLVEGFEKLMKMRK